MNVNMQSLPVFKYTQESFSVMVENIPEFANRREIVALFNNVIGDVCKSEDIKTPKGTSLEITFSTRYASQKALCLSGYLVSGMPIFVTPSSPAQRISKSIDTRRNLYVLGLPFSLTKGEFADVFSRYGVVSHCVILATVDNSSRRRGFVVMSTHDEANSAMVHLSRTRLKGNTLDISWAVVQRSQGFLDGGDRSSILDSRISEATPSENVQDRIYSHSGGQPVIAISTADGHIPLSSKPTTTIVVTNLPTVLFSHPADLHPLFCPFGKIKKLEILATPVHYTDSFSVTVEYSTTSSAQEAKETLQGQSYANHTLTVEHVRTLTPGVGSLSGSSTSTDGNVNTSSLNPFAAPFVLETSSSPGFRVPSSLYYDSGNYNYSNGLLSKAQNFPYHAQPLPSGDPCFAPSYLTCKRPIYRGTPNRLCGQYAFSNLSNVPANTPSYPKWHGHP